MKTLHFKERRTRFYKECFRAGWYCPLSYHHRAWCIRTIVDLILADSSHKYSALYILLFTWCALQPCSHPRQTSAPERSRFGPRRLSRLEAMIKSVHPGRSRLVETADSKNHPSTHAKLFSTQHCVCHVAAHQLHTCTWTHPANVGGGSKHQIFMDF